jgi:hypothetical protein
MISNRQLPIDRLAIVKVFGIERAAPGFQCGGNNQCVIDVVAVLLRNSDGSLVRIDRQRDWLRTEGSNNSEGSTNFLPTSVKFASRDSNKLVKDLDRKRTAGRQQSFALAKFLMFSVAN